MNSIYDYGDKKHIILHTDENATFQWAKDLAGCVKVIDYEQEQPDKKIAKVAADIYFPRSYKGWLERRFKSKTVGVK